MNYNDKYKLIYYAPMRTATRAINSIFKKTGFYCTSVNSAPVYYDFDHSIPSDKINEDITKSDYKTICSVRNPYSRMISNWNLYRFHIQNQKASFEKFIEDVFINKSINYKKNYISGLENPESVKKYQVNYHIGFMENPPDYIIRYEHLEEDIIKIPGVLENFNKVEEEIEKNIRHNVFNKERILLYLPYIGPGGWDLNFFEEHWKKHYNEELASLVYKELKDQFKIFDYCKNSWL